MPSLRVLQTDHRQLGDILLFGDGWAADSVRLTIDGNDFLGISAFTGAVSGSTVQPADGRFLLRAWLPVSTAGDVSIEAHETAGQRRTETAALQLPPASDWPLPPTSRDPAAQLRDFNQQAVATKIQGRACRRCATFRRRGASSSAARAARQTGPRSARRRSGMGRRSRPFRRARDRLRQRR